VGTATPSPIGTFLAKTNRKTKNQQCCLCPPYVCGNLFFRCWLFFPGPVFMNPTFSVFPSPSSPPPFIIIVWRFPCFGPLCLFSPLGLGPFFSFNGGCGTKPFFGAFIHLTVKKNFFFPNQAHQFPPVFLFKRN